MAPVTTQKKESQELCKREQMIFCKIEYEKESYKGREALSMGDNATSFHTVDSLNSLF